MLKRNDDLVEIARRYLGAIEEGDRDGLLALYAPDAEQIELPNRLKAGGDHRPPEVLARDLERGKTILASQRYDVISAIAEGNRVALRVTWTGILAIPLGQLKAGDAMVAHSAIFFEFEDGRIRRQFNYDCFETF